MKQYLATALALGFFVASLSAQAAETTAVLDVHHAGCVLCGPIIKSTLEYVKGVKAVRVVQPSGDANVRATVSYDDAVTNVAALIIATINAGYPASIVP